jgi:hypothetical protein
VADPTGGVHAHVTAAVAAAGGPVRMQHTRPNGTAESGGGFVMISGASLTAGVATLTVSSFAGLLQNLDVSFASTLTLPETANATAFQKRWAHADDTTNWGG